MVVTVMGAIATTVGWLGTRPDLMILVAVLLMALALVVSRGRSA